MSERACRGPVKHTPEMGGEIETGRHCRLARIRCDVDHRHTAIALLHRPDVRRRQAEQVAEDRFVDGVMGTTRSVSSSFRVVEICPQLRPERAHTS